MKAGRRPVRRAGWIMLAALAVVGGCSGDIAGELSRNVNVRERVMSAIAADSALTGEMTQRLLVNDTLRKRVIEIVLADDRSAQYVVGRIGRSPDAVGYVLQSAAADSAGRAHLMGLVKEMNIAMRGATK